MDNDLELTLIACLDALDAGEPIEQILARHPADAAALRPLLEAAVALPMLDMTPASEAQAASRRAFLNRAAAQLPMSRRSLFGLPVRLGLALATVLLALILVGGTTFASAAALPGDPLYGLKRSVEQVEVALAGNPEQANRRIEERRRDEVRQLIAAGREEEVRFDGLIEALDGSSLTIGGITVTLGPATLVEGEPHIGARASVSGQTSRAGIRAAELRIEPRSAPLLAPTTTSTATATVAAAPSRTATLRPATETPTLTPPPSTDTPAPSVTPAPSPRPATPTIGATIAPVPTAEAPAIPPLPEPSPTFEDNGNDSGGEGDDNGNDSSGGGDDSGG